MQIILEVFVSFFLFLYLKIKWKIGQVSYDGFRLSPILRATD